MRLDDLTGQIFGKLTVIARSKTSTAGHTKWLCRCVCGVNSIVESKNLKRGATKSCGCGRIKHAMYGTQTYRAWTCMLSRCRNENDPSYINYGGRGIGVCDQWSSFENFYADMGAKPKNHTIERIDNDKDYSPDNCRWATTHEQARNTRNNINIELFGEIKCLRDWVNDPRTSVNAYSTAWGRLKRGYTPYEAVMK